jgi:hypothetical protein
MDEPTPIVPMDDGNFTSDETATVVLGECRCPGRPHAEDTAELYSEIPWGPLMDAEMLTGAAQYRCIVLGALASWNLLDEAGDPIPINSQTVARLRLDRLVLLKDSLQSSLERTMTPLPNGSGAPSRRSRRESASPNPTIRPRARHTR